MTAGSIGDEGSEVIVRQRYGNFNLERADICEGRAIICRVRWARIKSVEGCQSSSALVARFKVTYKSVGQFATANGGCVLPAWQRSTETESRAEFYLIVLQSIKSISMVWDRTWSNRSVEFIIVGTTICRGACPMMSSSCGVCTRPQTYSVLFTSG